MIPAVLAALMAAAAVACVLPGRRGRNMTVAIAAAFMSLAFVCTVPSVYRALDGLTGDMDVADLVKHSFFVIAVAFLGRGVVMASGAPVRAPALWWLVPAGVLVLQAVAFVLVQGRHGSSGFMTSYGDQPAAVVYSIAHFGFFGVTFVAAGAACLASGFVSAPGAVRTAVGVLLAGCVVSVGTAAVLVTRDLLRVTGQVDPSVALNRWYQPLLVLSVLLVAVGLAVPPIAAGLERRAVAREVPVVVDRLRAIRDRLSAGDPTLRLPEGVRAPGGEPSPLDRVHRLVVEVRDQLFLHPEAVLSEDESSALDRGERLLARTDLD